MLIAVAVALVLAVLASTFVYQQLSRAGAARVSQAVTKIVVASAPLAFGSRLEETSLRVIDWPAAQPLAGSFSRPADCVGRAVLVPLVENEPILEANLAPQAGGAGLAAVIPKGFRAVSVAVNDVVSVSGFIQPGSRVDVLATGSAAGQNASNMTRSVLQGIRVLAIGQKIEADKQGAPQTVPVITLLVSPDEANILTLASTLGRIQLALRNTMDVEKVASNPAEQAWLFASYAVPTRKSTGSAIATPTPPRNYPIEVIRGNKRETEALPKP